MVEIRLIYVLLFAIIDDLIIVISGTYFLTRAYGALEIEKMHTHIPKKERTDSSYDLFVSGFNKVRKRLFLSFYVLELALIAFFLFWGALFYFNVRII